jgi:hypothetical protein
MTDNGQSQDAIPADGLFSGVYTRANQASEVEPAVEEDDNELEVPTPKDEGSYRVRMFATGPGFQREALGAFMVLEAPDANADGLSDAFEAEYEVTNAGADPDCDGLSNLEEYNLGTDPNFSDTDRGGESDGSESTAGRDPLDSADDAIEAPGFFVAEVAGDFVRLYFEFNPNHTFVFYRTPIPGQCAVITELELVSDQEVLDIMPMVAVTVCYGIQAMDGQGRESALLWSGPITVGPAIPTHKRCDANDDGSLNISDPVRILNYLFLGGPEPDCIRAMDCNMDLAPEPDMSDAVFLLNALFLGGPTWKDFNVCEAFPDCSQTCE